MAFITPMETVMKPMELMKPLNNIDDVQKVENKLKYAEKHSDKIDDGIYVLMLGSLALLDHGLDGNNIEAMSEAKKKLQEHLAKNS